MKRVRVKASEPAEEKEAPGKPFAKGRGKTGGRTKGTPNKHSAVLKDCMARAMEMVGNNNRGKDGAEGYLAWLAWRKPEIFGRLLEKLLPYSLTGANGGPVQVEYNTKADIVQRFKERGLPIPRTLLLAPPQAHRESETEH